MRGLTFIVMAVGLGVILVAMPLIWPEVSTGTLYTEDFRVSSQRTSEPLLNSEYQSVLSAGVVAGKLNKLLSENDWTEIIGQPSDQLAAAGGSDRIAVIVTRAHIELGRLKSLPSALAQLDQAYRSGGKPGITSSVGLIIYTTASRIAIRADQPALAVELIDQALANAGADLAARNRLLATRGRMQLALGDTIQALEDWSKAVRIAPEYPWALLARGLHHSQQGNQQQALSDLHQAYLLRDNAPDFTMPTGRYTRLLRDKFNALVARGDWAAGTVYLSMGTPISSTRELTLMFESTLRFIEQNFQKGEYLRVIEAAHQLKSTIETLDSPRLTAIFEGQLAKLVASFGESSASYEMTLVLYEQLMNPQSAYSMELGADGRAELLSIVAALFHLNGDLAQMSEALILAAELSPTNVRVNKFLGDISFTLEDYNSAERFYSVALIGTELQRDFLEEYTSAKLNRGISNLERQAFLKARDDFDDLLQLSPANNIVRYWRAKTLAALDKPRLAQADFDISLPTMSRDTLILLQMQLQSKGLLAVYSAGSYDLATRKAMSACIETNCLASR